LALDYALGTGGWPLGHPVHVFGKPDIGKSSVIGFNAIRNAQAEGKLCGIIAIEPGFDEAWAAKNGVDLER
jgi:recombination protein RecA